MKITPNQRDVLELIKVGMSPMTGAGLGRNETIGRNNTINSLVQHKLVRRTTRGNLRVTAAGRTALYGR